MIIDQQQTRAEEKHIRSTDRIFIPGVQLLKVVFQVVAKVSDIPARAAAAQLLHSLSRISLSVGNHPVRFDRDLTTARSAHRIGVSRIDRSATCRMILKL